MVSENIAKLWVSLIKDGQTKKGALEEISVESKLSKSEIQQQLKDCDVWLVEGDGFKYFNKHNCSRLAVSRWRKTHLKIASALAVVILMIGSTFLLPQSERDSSIDNIYEEEELTFEESRRIDRAMTCHSLGGVFDYQEESCLVSN